MVSQLFEYCTRFWIFISRNFTKTWLAMTQAYILTTNTLYVTLESRGNLPHNSQQPHAHGLRKKDQISLQV